MGIAGNEEADKADKETAERPSTRQCLERFTSLAHVICTIMEQKWKEARHWFRSKFDS